MVNIWSLQFVGFYENINKIYREIPPEEIFKIAYLPLLDVVEYNAKRDNLCSKCSPEVRVLDRSKYLEYVRKVKERYIARFSLDGIIREFTISPRKDEKLLRSLEGYEDKYGRLVVLNKIPAALLLQNPNYGVLVLREARFYENKYYPRKFVIRGLDDILKLGRGPYYGIIEEPYVLILNDFTKLTLKVISSLYRQENLPMVYKAFLYIRPFYPLLYSERENIGEDVKDFIKEFIKRELRYGVFLQDFDLTQIAISYDRGVIITDPEFAYLSYLPKKQKYLKKSIGFIYPRIGNIIRTKNLKNIIDELKKTDENLPIGYFILKSVLHRIKNEEEIPKFLNRIYRLNSLNNE